MCVPSSYNYIQGNNYCPVNQCHCGGVRCFGFRSPLRHSLVTWGVLYLNKNLKEVIYIFIRTKSGKERSNKLRDIWNSIPLKSHKQNLSKIHTACSCFPTQLVRYCFIPTSSEAITQTLLSGLLSELNAHFRLCQRLISLFWLVISRDL